jgi:hypothetical protein
MMPKPEADTKPDDVFNDLLDASEAMLSAADKADALLTPDQRARLGKALGDVADVMIEVLGEPVDDAA